MAEIQETPVIGRGGNDKLQEDDVRVKSMQSLGQDSRLSQTKKAEELVIVAKDGQAI